MPLTVEICFTASSITPDTIYFRIYIILYNPYREPLKERVTTVKHRPQLATKIRPNRFLSCRPGISEPEPILYLHIETLL
jgi:hypothetical protein